MGYRIKNWGEYQSYKDGRNLIWIRLYKRLLDDDEFHTLSGWDAKYLVMLWLLASEKNGNLPTPYKISFRLRITEKQATELLSALSHWVERYDDGLSQACDKTEKSCHIEEKREEEKRIEEKREVTLAAEPPPSVASKSLLEIWENNRGAMSAVRSFTNQRLNKCKTLLRKPSFNPEDFRAAVCKASTTPFLLGVDGGWKASFDWFIANDTNYQKVLEGKYDSAPRKGSDGRRQRNDPDERTRQNLEAAGFFNP